MERWVANPTSSSYLPTPLQKVHDLTERLMLAEAQCFTHWELLRRLHDMIVVFDMEGAGQS